MPRASYMASAWTSCPALRSASALPFHGAFIYRPFIERQSNLDAYYHQKTFVFVMPQVRSAPSWARRAVESRALCCASCASWSPARAGSCWEATMRPRWAWPPCGTSWAWCRRTPRSSRDPSASTSTPSRNSQTPGSGRRFRACNSCPTSVRWRRLGREKSC